MSLGNVNFIRTEPDLIPFEENERFLIFTGIRNKGLMSFILLDKEIQNDESLATGKNVSYGVKWNGNAGSIFSVKVVNNEGSISYKKHNLPIGFWKNKEQLLEWQIIQRGNEVRQKTSKQTKEDILIKALEPIKDIYLSQRSRVDKASILSIIIQYLQQ